MYQSKLFTKTAKETPKNEQSLNAQLLVRAGFVDKLLAGVYTFLPLGLRVMNKIENIIREEMNNIGGQEIFMPSLQLKDSWIKTGRWNAMDDLYKLKDAGGREFALGPTHEEIVVPLMKKFISSYKELPVYVYQFQNKFRMELRAKSGLLRGREFMMKDMYSFHLNEDDLNDYYERAKKAYWKIFNRVGIGHKTYLTYASGGTFSKYSHEFQTVTPAGEDTIFICSNCETAVNKEIIGDIKKCPECGKDSFQSEEKSIEVGNIFKLKDKYTEPFDLTVVNDKGEKVKVVMGCYGIGLGRLMGTIVELFNDQQGIFWPEEVAPFKIHLISIKSDKNAEKIYHKLLDNNIDVLYDDRDISAGVKFADADLIGVPWRLVVSEKTLADNAVELKKRDSEKAEIVRLNEIVSAIAK